MVIKAEIGDVYQLTKGKTKHTNIEIKISKDRTELYVTMKVNDIARIIPFHTKVVDGKLSTQDWWGWGD